jgi:ribosome-associated heat shock protein Hsp15
VDAAAPAGLRADVWLWAARFFKTRSLCRQAIDAGHVEVNSVACKPARLLHVGSMLRITRGEDRIEVEVLALSDRRGPAAVAQALYRETSASMALRQTAHEQRRMLGPIGPGKRPDKASRRELLRLKQGY